MGSVFKKYQDWSINFLMFLTKNKILQVQHPPHSPDLQFSANSFVYYTEISIEIFEDVEDIKDTWPCRFTLYQKKIFQRCFSQWKTLWNKSVKIQKDYFGENQHLINCLFLF